MDIADQITELESDLREIKCLLEKCERKRVQDALVQEQKKIQQEMDVRKQEAEMHVAKEPGHLNKAAQPSANKAYTVKIHNYGWDQSDNFVKIYVTLKGVHKLAPDNVEASFTERSFVLLVKDLDGKNHQMTMNNLLCSINVADSCRKIKTDMVLVMCKKKTQKKWECLTQVEKQTKDKEKPTYDENADPSEGLMNMLKKIYSEGDDEMKRTINKAWTESQEKKLKGEAMDF